MNCARTSSQPALLIVCLAACLAAEPASATDFYVATNGSDANPGTRAKPFATLERARDAARNLGQGHSDRRSGSTIWLRSGDYVRTNALELTTADSGAAGAPVVWRA